MLRSFLMFCFFHRRFVKSFAEVAAPLHALNGDGAAFVWRPRIHEAFNELKCRIAHPPILAFSNATKLFVVLVDAC